MRRCEARLGDNGMDAVGALVAREVEGEQDGGGGMEEDGAAMG